MSIVCPKSLDRLLRGIAGKYRSIEIADEILGRAAAEVASGIDVDDHDPLRLPFRRSQWEEIGTLELARPGAVTIAPCAHVLPVSEILRRIEPHFLVGGDDHDPLLLRLIPKDFGVTEILDADIAVFLFACR